MPWNPSTGQFERQNQNFSGNSVWDQDRQAQIKIISTRHDYHDNDMAAGISECLNINGLNAMQASLDMGGFSIANLLIGSDPDDVATYGQVVTSGAFDNGLRELTLTTPNGDLSPILIPAGTTALTEGAWTPLMNNATEGSQNKGWYTRDGRLVTALAHLHWTARTSSTTELKISGLPFNIANAASGIQMEIYIGQWFPLDGMKVSGIGSSDNPEAVTFAAIHDDADDDKTIRLAAYFGTNNTALHGYGDFVFYQRLQDMSASGKCSVRYSYLTDDP
jgi:hypothetical protein